MNILVTGAGFIGFHTIKELARSKNKIYGLDSLNNYYSVKLKKKNCRFKENFKKILHLLKQLK